jgi:hypothetical protein
MQLTFSVHYVRSFGLHSLLALWNFGKAAELFKKSSNLMSSARIRQVRRAASIRLLHSHSPFPFSSNWILLTLDLLRLIASSLRRLHPLPQALPLTEPTMGWFWADSTPRPIAPIAPRSESATGTTPPVCDHAIPNQLKGCRKS